MALLIKAGEEELDLIYDFLYELAQYEKVEESLAATKQRLHEWFFEKNVMEAYFAADEILFVKPSCRGKGYGKFLITELQKKVKEQNDMLVGIDHLFPV